MTDFTIRDTCRLCDGPIREVLRLPDTPLANEYPRYDANTDCFEAAGKRFTRACGQDKFPLYLAQCESCGHVQLPVVVDPKRLFPPDYPYQSGTSPVFRAHLAELANVIEDMKPAGGKLLDIASNDGSFLACFRGSPWAVTGVDPATPEGIGYRAFFSHDWATTHRSVTERQYDVITALNVFAHVDDLNDFTAGVAELLAPDGVFVFEVGYLPDVIAKGLVGCVYHEHLSYHTLPPLIPFFDHHGLSVRGASRVDSQGGSLRVFVGHKNRLSVHTSLLNDDRSGSDVARLAEYIEMRRLETYGTIRKFTTMGKKVAAFGAPAKLTTWCYALGLTGDDLICVYDDNPLKVGRFTPGTFIPIVPSSRLLEDQPDAVILFSSNFEAEIRERFKAYRGEWIVL